MTVIGDPNRGPRGTQRPDEDELVLGSALWRWLRSRMSGYEEIIRSARVAALVRTRPNRAAASDERNGAEATSLSRYADHLRSGRVKGWMARSTFLPILLLAISKSYCVCRFCQSCALVPKYRDNRSAISAVIARRRRTISLTVGAATPSSFATL